MEERERGQHQLKLGSVEGWSQAAAVEKVIRIVIVTATMIVMRCNEREGTEGNRRHRKKMKKGRDDRRTDGPTNNIAPTIIVGV